MILFDHPNMRLESVDNYILHQYFQLIDQATWINGFSAGLEFYQKAGGVHWLNDLTEFWGTDCDNVIWLHRVVNERIKQNKKFMKIGFVPPIHPIKHALQAMNFYIDYSTVDFSDHPVHIAKFQNLKTAQEWIRL